MNLAIAASSYLLIRDRIRQKTLKSTSRRLLIPSRGSPTSKP
jgi:hypothetical protein